jgi:hypothetical protein
MRALQSLNFIEFQQPATAEVINLDDAPVATIQNAVIIQQMLAAADAFIEVRQHVVTQ